MNMRIVGRIVLAEWRFVPAPDPARVIHLEHKPCGTKYAFDWQHARQDLVLLKMQEHVENPQRSCLVLADDEHQAVTR